MLKGRPRSPSRKKSGRLLLGGRSDSRDITIRRPEAQLAELTQIMVAKNLMKPAPGAEERSFRDLTLNPPIDLWDLMTRVEMFAQLENDIWQAKQATGFSSWGDGAFKKRQRAITPSSQPPPRQLSTLPNSSKQLLGSQQIVVGSSFPATHRG
ncbi:hypothetical protein Acr_10g0007240 [Actinidia rufa]|uniref:Uncharacterized protein n=1 Tax=Actinidia rufa TaxID=165716 RepID=A0A7J0FAX3_9ERIC|nr:hypothetical protein Acr_10g0007240 [Actinidia rufa]